jgi:hypothetical protein
MSLFPKQTTAQHIQASSWKTMNTCHECHCEPGLRSMYMATASFPSMELIDAADRSQAQAFKYPVKKPTNRPYSWLDTDAQ